MFLSLLLAINSAFADEFLRGISTDKTNEFLNEIGSEETKANLHHMLFEKNNSNSAQSDLTKGASAFDKNSSQNKNTQDSVSNETNTLITNTLTINTQNSLNTNEQNPLTANPQTPLITESAESGDNAFKSFFVEFGLGYTRMNFKATQTPLDKIYTSEGVTTDIYERQKYPKKGVGNGVDMFLTLNFRLTQKFGVNVGVGGEVIAVKWESALLDYNYRKNRAGEAVAQRHFSIDSISKDTLMNAYITLGAFYDIWQGKERAVRVFGNAGLAASEFQKSSFETDYHTSRFSVFDTEGSITHRFYTLGVRFNFARQHGIELASKLKGKFKFDDKSAVKTDISWDNTLNLRYVWEF